MKRLFDVIFAVFWLVFTAPVLLVMAIFIKLDSSGPILYVPQMVGKHGQLFRLLRFRTMYISAASDLDQDKGFTRVGRFICNYSLDHLPTLVNVLKGDLSVIGLRPMEAEYVDLQDPMWQRYFQVRPGLFNYAVLKLGKTYGHSQDRNLHLKRELELEYIQQQSLVIDLQLFLQTVWAHIVSRGNIKARGNPDPALEDKISSCETH